jgi:hypothetical protein
MSVASLLVELARRHVLPSEFPLGRTVLHFRLEGAPRQRRYWWIVVQHGDEEDVDVCLTDPGYAVGITVTGRLRTLVDVLMGDAKLAEVLRQELLLVEGEPKLIRRFEMLFEFGPSDSFTGAHAETRATRRERALSPS